MQIAAFPADDAQTAHETFTPTSPAVTSPPADDLLRMLAQLAALPPEQRAAIAVLIAPAPTVTLATPPVAREPDRLHPGYEETK
jgi:hypothetical protein